MEQGWHSGESACLPLRRPGFDSWTRHHLWVEFVVGSFLALRDFSQGTRVPLSSKTNIHDFQFDPESKGHRTKSMIFFYLFYHVIRRCQSV